MTEHRGPAALNPVEPMALYEIYWTSGMASGMLCVWAPDADTAVATVKRNPGSFGVPHEHPIVGRPYARRAGRLTDAA